MFQIKLTFIPETKCCQGSKLQHSPCGDQTQAKLSHAPDRKVNDVELRNQPRNREYKDKLINLNYPTPVQRN